MNPLQGEGKPHIPDSDKEKVVMEMECLIIRRLTGEDVSAVTEMEKKCFSSSWSEEQYRYALVEDNHFVAWGAFIENSLVAYVACYLTVDELEIANIAVSPELRAKRIGTQLLRKALEEAKLLSATRCFLEVRRMNLPARRLYSGLGFSEVGVRKHYYRDTGEDALVMLCIL